MKIEWLLSETLSIVFIIIIIISATRSPPLIFVSNLLPLQQYHVIPFIGYEYQRKLFWKFREKWSRLAILCSQNVGKIFIGLSINMPHKYNTKHKCVCLCVCLCVCVCTLYIRCVLFWNWTLYYRYEINIHLLYR